MSSLWPPGPFRCSFQYQTVHIRQTILILQCLKICVVVDFFLLLAAVGMNNALLSSLRLPPPSAYLPFPWAPWCVSKCSNKSDQKSTSSKKNSNNNSNKNSNNNNNQTTAITTTAATTHAVSSAQRSLIHSWVISHHRQQQQQPQQQQQQKQQQQQQQQEQQQHHQQQQEQQQHIGHPRGSCCDPTKSSESSESSD